MANRQEQIAKALHDVLHEHHGDLDDRTYPDNDPRQRILNGSPNGTAHVQPVDLAVRRLKGLHQLRPGSIDAARKILLNLNSDGPKTIPDHVEPERQRSEERTNDGV